MGFIPENAKKAGHNRTGNAQYRDACAGKETSAGWLLRGELITTPNAETARASGVFPGVVRDLFLSHGSPTKRRAVWLALC